MCTTHYGYLKVTRLHTWCTDKDGSGWKSEAICISLLSWAVEGGLFQQCKNQHICLLARSILFCSRTEMEAKYLNFWWKYELWHEDMDSSRLRCRRFWYRGTFKLTTASVLHKKQTFYNHLSSLEFKYFILKRHCRFRVEYITLTACRCLGNSLHCLSALWRASMLLLF